LIDSSSFSPQTLYVVATPIGNLNDITPRAIAALGFVDVIAAEDTRRTLGLLTHFGIKKRVVSNFKHNENSRAQKLIDQILNEGISIAIVSDAGTPCIADPGSVLVKLAREQGVDVIPIPGASAVTAALSASGFEFDSFKFLGFIPRTKKEREAFFSTMKTDNCNTFVFFESPRRIVDSLTKLAETLPDCSMLVTNEITKRYEKSYWGDIRSVIEKLQEFAETERGEYTIVTQINSDSTEISYTMCEIEETSMEALLVDLMKKQNISLKEAQGTLIENASAPRNAVYKAALNLKKMFL